MKILVTGAGGQLADALRDEASTRKGYEFHFLSRKELDITDSYKLTTQFNLNNYDYIINTAAYTNVDGAETSKDLAQLVNGKALVGLSKAANSIGAPLIHISTDYVFSGKSSTLYKETDTPDPVNYYGQTKLDGEQAVLELANQGAIIRTSWLYHYRGTNFVRKILSIARKKHLDKDKTPIKVVSDQIGAPTSAVDLASFIMRSVDQRRFKNGVEIYNYTNTGVASWYDLAVATVNFFNSEQVVSFTKKEISLEVVPVTSKEFPTAAIRPSFSLLDLTKIQKDFGVTPPSWMNSLRAVTQFGPDCLL